MATITGPEVHHFIDTVFGGLDEAVHALLLERLGRRVLACGERLWSAGDPADGLAFVLHGRLRIVGVDGVDGERDWAGELGRGQALGVAELVARRRRSSTVTALRESEILILSAADFDAVLAVAPGFVIPLLRGLATRLDRALRGERGLRAPETVALLPLEPGLALRRLADDLAVHLRRGGSVHVTDADAVDHRLGPGRAQSPIDGADDEAVGALLDDLDDAHDVDLYVADAADTPWTRRCLARADRIVLVAVAGGDPEPRPIERLTDDEGPAPNRAPRELLLLQRDDGTPPVGTAAWLIRRSVERHHHVRRDRQSDLARLARRLSHRSVGLVLSGGAARGMVHIGLIRGLLAAGVPIDAVGGASAGGGVGVLLAAEFSIDDMIRGITEAWIESGAFRRPHVPLISLFEADAVREGLLKWVGERKMEDLWRDCFVVATNLSRARLEVIDQGPIWHAILSTAAIPGILPPTYRDGEVLVDGGVLDNMPIGVMLARNPGRVIASDVGDLGDALLVPRELLIPPTNTRLLLEKINPFDDDTPVPSIAQTLLATITCTARVRDPGLLGRILHLFTPDLRGLPALAFKDPKPLLEAGERAAAEAIAAGVFAAVIGGG